MYKEYSGADMEPVQKNKHPSAASEGKEKKTGGSDASAPPHMAAAKNRAKDSERLGQLSSSLQKAYQTTVNEAVPDSMMDLLKKLG